MPQMKQIEIPIEIKSEIEKYFYLNYNWSEAIFNTEAMLMCLLNTEILHKLALENGYIKDQSKWIDCNDKLPENYNNVWCYIPEVGVCVGYCNLLSKIWSHFYGNAKVTHWMPMIKPEPPKYKL